MTVFTFVHIHIYLELMELEQSVRESAWNPRKLGVDFADAAVVFSEDLALTMPDADPLEDRFVTISMDALGRYLGIVHRGGMNKSV